ncbi:hypothetical protein [Acidianus sp. HS-5]|uniref:hypothetical protein n=1 Tax=Acidianus sp. HS-5 TaxID=2886040 RepID=UPI001F230FC4|nr:hypothetical protein [Acidianus sp. HS-5]BDC17519.1 hypothetical protein HS5_04090 [Acidianus sp. HS-5]
MCEFKEYTVSRFGEKSKVAGKLWTQTLRKIEDVIIKRKDEVITIVGSPGMGKTTLLNSVYNGLSNNYIIYLDLVNSPSISSSAWRFVKVTKFYERVKVYAFNLLLEHKKDIGYVFFAKIREFPNWLRHAVCEKEEWDKDWGFAERLYCMPYEGDIEGFIEFLKDLQKLGNVGLLLDEMKLEEGQLKELHKLINEVGLPIIISMTPEVFSNVSDSALSRRLKEAEVELKLSDEDKADILKAYCEEYYEDLLKVEEVIKAVTINELLDKARTAYEEALEKCKEEYKKDECIRREIGSSFVIENPIESSRQLEDKIREGLKELKEELGIKYVHLRGKKIEEKGVTADIYFKTDDAVYIGDIKLSNKDSLDNVGNMRKLEGLEKEGAYPVKKFIITNQDNVNLQGFKIIRISNAEVKKIIEGDREKRDELIRRIMSELKVG